jgi:LPXTG-motif cell wall-anchored protein
MNPIRAILATVVCMAPFALYAGVSMAEETLPPGLLIGDQDGIKVNYEGDYFIKAVNLVPGEVIVKKLTIKNVEKNEPSFKLSMTAQPLQSTGPIDLLNKVRLRLEIDKTLLYDGRIRGDEGVNMIENAIDLGKYSPGDQRVMTITLTVDDDIVISSEKSASNIKWHFYAVKKDGADPPKTGEIDKNHLLWLGAALALLAATFILTQKRRKEEKRD